MTAWQGCVGHALNTIGCSHNQNAGLTKLLHVMLRQDVYMQGSLMNHKPSKVTGMSACIEEASCCEGI